VGPVRADVPRTTPSHERVRDLIELYVPEKQCLT
jgi:hypothetical protein